MKKITPIRSPYGLLPLYLYLRKECIYLFEIFPISNEGLMVTFTAFNEFSLKKDISQISKISGRRETKI